MVSWTHQLYTLVATTAALLTIPVVLYHNSHCNLVSLLYLFFFFFFCGWERVSFSFSFLLMKLLGKKFFLRNFVETFCCYCCCCCFLWVWELVLIRFCWWQFFEKKFFLTKLRGNVFFFFFEVLVTVINLWYSFRQIGCIKCHFYNLWCRCLNTNTAYICKIQIHNVK